MSYISNYNTVKHGERGTVKDYVRLSSCVLMLHRSMVARAGEAGLAVLHKFFSFHEGRGVGGGYYRLRGESRFPIYISLVSSL